MYATHSVKCSKTYATVDFSKTLTIRFIKKMSYHLFCCDLFYHSKSFERDLLLYFRINILNKMSD